MNPKLQDRLYIPRRKLLLPCLTLGFGALPDPMSAQRPRVDSIVSEEVEVSTPDGGIPAYVSRPAQERGLPMVLVVHEIFGLTTYIRDICRQLAASGYYAISPDLFSRQGDPSKVASLQLLMRDIVSKVPDVQVLSDLDATFEFASRNGGDGKRAAVTGFSWGGRIAWLYSAHNPKLKAGAAWYGHLTGIRNPFQRNFPIDIAGQLRVPVLGLYGDKDEGIPIESVHSMREVLKESSSQSEILLFEGAPHGFHAVGRDSFRSETAENAWVKMNEWFRKRGLR